MASKANCTLFLGLVAFLGLMQCAEAAANKTVWTPDDFDWSVMKVAPEEEWSGLYINLTENPLPAHPALMELGGKEGQIGEHAVLLFPFSVGLAWQAFEWAVGIGSAVTAIQGCVTNDGSAGAIAGCAFGVAGTLLGIGTAYKAANSAGWFARASNTWLDSGLENIELAAFSKRGQDLHQEFHEQLMGHVLRSVFGSDSNPEFMGYVEDGHRLSRRDEDHLHPRAPMFRFHHPRHGPMDLASRDHLNGTRLTLSFGNPNEDESAGTGPGPLRVRQSFQHERFSDHVFEGRFDTEASEADPNNPSFDAAGGFQTIEDSVKCLGGGDEGTWEGGNVMSAQFYDTNAEATFGFASIGIFENNDNDGSLQEYAPQGMPLLQPEC